MNTKLSDVKMRVERGRLKGFVRGKPVYEPALLDDYGILTNDILRTLEDVELKLPKTAEAKARDTFTYALCGLRDKADPRNGAPEVDDVEAMFKALNLPESSLVFKQLGRYKDDLKTELNRLTRGERKAIKPLTFTARYQEKYPELMHIFRCMLAAPVTVASVERGFSMLHQMAGGGRRHRLGPSTTVNELRLRFVDHSSRLRAYRDDTIGILHAVHQQRAREHQASIACVLSPAASLGAASSPLSPSETSPASVRSRISLPAHSASMEDRSIMTNWLNEGRVQANERAAAERAEAARKAKED